MRQAFALVALLGAYGIIGSATAATDARTDYLALIDQTAAISDPDLAAQQLAAFYTMVGRPDLAAQAKRSAKRPLPDDRLLARCAAAVADHRAADAVDAILAAARDARAVIVNEDHGAPESRLLWLRLLEPLRRQGFTHLAVEALYVPLVPPAGGDLPSDMGTYIPEPVFSQVIRHGLRLGYRLEAYDDFASLPKTDDREARITARESLQARNLSGVLEADPDARMLVLVGWSHAAEVPVPLPSGAEMAWMAARLKSATGLDPLTVDTTFCRYGDHHPATAPGRVFLDMEGKPSTFGPYEGKVDLAVHLPWPEERTGLAAASAHRSALGKPVAIPDALKPVQGRIVIEAFRRDQAETTLPMDRLLLRPGDEGLSLFLPPGSYQLIGWGENGLEQGRMTIEVE